MQSCNQLKHLLRQCETRLLQLDGYGDLSRACIHRKVRNLSKKSEHLQSTTLVSSVSMSYEGLPTDTVKVYLRYGFGCQDPKAPRGVLRWVELPPPEVELVREGGS